MREKWLSVNWRELIIKTLMMLSYVSWIYLAIPASENGKIVGCGLLIIIFFFVIKMSMGEYLDGIVNKGKRQCFYQYNNSIILYWHLLLPVRGRRFCQKNVRNGCSGISGDLSVCFVLYWKWKRNEKG